MAHPGPSFSVHDVYIGWVDALRELGEQVVEFNLDHRLALYDNALLPTEYQGRFRKALTPTQAVELATNGLYAALYKVRPDVLFVISGFFIPEDVYVRCEQYGTRVIMLHTESPYEDDRQVHLAQFADLNILTDIVSLERFAAVAPTTFIGHAYRPEVHCPGPSTAAPSDFVFIGTGYESRIAFLEAMDLDGLSVTLAGNWKQLAPTSPLHRHLLGPAEECVDNEDAVALYRASRMGLNLYRREHSAGESAVGWSLGPRELEMAAVGLPFLRDSRGEGDEVLDMLPTFDSPGDAAEKLRWFLAHDEEREAIARKARAAVADRTFTNNAAALLRLLEGAA